MDAPELVLSREVRVEVDDVTLDGTLDVPMDPLGTVVFAHGSGSSRMSPRNRYVARVIQRHGMATLLFDLLTRDEEEVDLRTRHLRFDIPLLARRLEGAGAWVRDEEPVESLPIGYFGSSTGGGAALVAAARRPEGVAAVVSRGGRPDLAGEALPHVRAPTLLIVGSRDESVIQMNEAAMRDMRADVELRLVPGATHLFEEPGALEEVAQMAASFFEDRLGAAAAEP